MLEKRRSGKRKFHVDLADKVGFDSIGTIKQLPGAPLEEELETQS